MTLQTKWEILVVNKYERILRFFYEFISIFIEGILMMVKGIIEGFTRIVNYNDYKKIIDSYRDSFNGPDWLLLGLTVGL